ncbi:hypothetical protein CBS101457_001604 [Exobasidium rhododendri]|nr:hypothetical protein CBS101457_001604 [Exobasidium rhododendri]
MDTESAAPAAAAAAPTPADYYRQVNQQRFTIELEFLSSLSSPPYLTYLHSLGSFQSPSFLRYLAYLHQTWSQPQYLKYVRYPNAILLCKALVDSPEFRNMIARDGWEGEMSKQIIRQWAGSRASTAPVPTSSEQQPGDSVKPADGAIGQESSPIAATSVKMEEGV